MVNMKFFLSLLVSVSAFAGGSKRSSGPVPSHRKPSSSAKVFFAKNGWTIKSVKDIPAIGITTTKNGVITWDLKGAILDGKNQKGDGSQDENQEPLFRVYTALVVKNGFIRNVKNGATFNVPKCGIENVTFTNIGEDALALSRGAYSFTAKGNEFINDSGGDKSVQFNEARDALFQDNMIFGGVTCMRIGDSTTTSVSETATVKGNRFIECDTAMHASKITVKESGNKFEGVNTPWKSANGAVRK